MCSKESEKILEEIERFLNDERKFKRVVFKADRMLNEALGYDHEVAMNGKDVVMELIESLQKGKRKRNRQAVPGLDQWLYTQLRSMVDCIAKRERRFPPLPEIRSDDGEQHEEADARVASEKKPEDEYESEEFVNEIRKEIDSDIEAGVVFEEIAKYSENEEIAKDLGMKIPEVVNAKRRIQRKADVVYLRGR
jgi:DNA-directed RNA polymerase specialized sigma24 family protein